MKIKVKIRDKWYSSDDEFISLQFDEKALEEIKTLNIKAHPNLRVTIGRTLHSSELEDWRDKQ